MISAAISIAYLAAQLFSVSFALGAFFAGLVVATPNAAPIIPIYYNTHIFLVQPSVRGWNPTLLDHHPYKHVWLEP